MKNLSEEEKLYLLSKIENDIPNKSEFSEDELNILYKFSSDENSNIRSYVARILVDFTEEKGENILIKLTNDKDELVRAEACDSLKESKSKCTYDLLANKARFDNDEIVRGYSINSLGEISLRLGLEKDTIDFLKTYLLKEESVFIKINIFNALYILGNKEYLKEMIEILDTQIYQNRCAIINCLKEIVDKDNFKIIYEALCIRESKENSYAVISAINNLKEFIKKKYF